MTILLKRDDAKKSPDTEPSFSQQRDLHDFLLSQYAPIETRFQELYENALDELQESASDNFIKNLAETFETEIKIFLERAPNGLARNQLESHLRKTVQRHLDRSVKDEHASRLSGRALSTEELLTQYTNLTEQFPENAESYLAEGLETLERLAQTGINRTAIEDRATSFQAEIIDAALQGATLIDPDLAETFLADPAFSHLISDEQAILKYRQKIASIRELNQSQQNFTAAQVAYQAFIASTQEHAKFVSDLDLALEDGTATEAIIAKAQFDDLIDETDATRLTAKLASLRAADREQQALADTVQDFLDTHLPPNPQDPLSQEAIDAHYETSLQPYIAELEDAKRILVEDSYIRKLGKVPTLLRKHLHGELLSDEAEVLVNASLRLDNLAGYDNILENLSAEIPTGALLRARAIAAFVGMKIAPEKMVPLADEKIAGKLAQQQAKQLAAQKITQQAANRRETRTPLNQTPGIRSLAVEGRNGDTEIAHLTPGELVIPRQLMTPELQQTLQAAFTNSGLDIGRYTVGGTDDSINPATGMREYFWDYSDVYNDPGDSDSTNEGKASGTGSGGAEAGSSEPSVPNNTDAQLAAAAQGASKQGASEHRYDDPDYYNADSTWRGHAGNTAGSSDAPWAGGDYGGGYGYRSDGSYGSLPGPDGSDRSSNSLTGSYGYPNSEQDWNAYGVAGGQAWDSGDTLGQANNGVYQETSRGIGQGRDAETIPDHNQVAYPSNSDRDPNSQESSINTGQGTEPHTQSFSEVFGSSHAASISPGTPAETAEQAPAQTAADKFAADFAAGFTGLDADAQDNNFTFEDIVAKIAEDLTTYSGWDLGGGPVNVDPSDPSNTALYEAEDTTPASQRASMDAQDTAQKLADLTSLDERLRTDEFASLTAGAGLKPGSVEYKHAVATANLNSTKQNFRSWEIRTSALKSAISIARRSVQKASAARSAGFQARDRKAIGTAQNQSNRATAELKSLNAEYRSSVDALENARAELKAAELAAAKNNYTRTSSIQELRDIIAVAKENEKEALRSASNSGKIAAKNPANITAYSQYLADLHKANLASARLEATRTMNGRLGLYEQFYLPDWWQVRLDNWENIERGLAITEVAKEINKRSVGIALNHTITKTPFTPSISNQGSAGPFSFYSPQLSRKNPVNDLDGTQTHLE